MTFKLMHCLKLGLWPMQSCRCQPDMHNSHSLARQHSLVLGHAWIDPLLPGESVTGDSCDIVHCAATRHMSFPPHIGQAVNCRACMHIGVQRERVWSRSIWRAGPDKHADALYEISCHLFVKLAAPCRMCFPSISLPTPIV